MKALDLSECFDLHIELSRLELLLMPVHMHALVVGIYVNDIDGERALIVSQKTYDTLRKEGQI